MSAYVPPAASKGDSCSGGCGSTTDNKYQYLRGYFNAHMLSMPSHRYEYITWFTLALVIIITAAFYHAGISDQSFVGAAWSRWAVKTRVIKIGRKEDTVHRDLPSSPSKPPTKRRAVLTLTSFGRTLLLLALIIVPIVLTIVGADYIRPTAGVFDMRESWPNSTISPFAVGLNRRLLWGQGTYPRVTTNPPSITLPYRTWWTAGGRTGAMTNALTPFIVVVALKQVPFALLSTKLLGGLAFDRLSFMHKWGGRVVWLFATAHIALWSVQLSRDHAFGGTMWAFVFMWTKFRWGWVSYGFFTLLILLSVGPIRSNYYEFFYVAHVVCAVGFMITAWLHHPPLGAWMYATLLWWLLERIVRAIKVAYINGIGFTGRSKAHVAVLHGPSHANTSSFHSRHIAGQKSMSAASSYTMHSDAKAESSPYMHSFATSRHSRPQYSADQQRTADGNMTLDRSKTQRGAQYDPVYDVIDGYAGAEQAIPMHNMATSRYSLHDVGPTVDSTSYAPSTSSQTSEAAHMRPSTTPSPYHTSAEQYQRSYAGRSARPTQPRPSMAADVAATLRPGFAFAQLLPGKTLRLTLRTPNQFAWQPGQYVNLNVPKVRWWQSHPFTVASAYNADYPSSTEFREEDAEKGLVSKGTGGAERTIVLLLRARQGFTHYLWDHVRLERERQIRQIEETTGVQYAHGEVAKTATGVHLRALIDGPFGSASRTRWGIHSTVLIICGGSGISYGMAVLEHLCAVMAGIKQVPNFRTRRVRFVWILREYSHLQWIASALRRCVEMVPPEMLQVDLFVTSSRAAQRARSHHPHSSQDALYNSTHDGNRGDRAGEQLHMPVYSYDDGHGRFTDGNDQDEYDVDAYALTQFDGEDNSAPTAAEARINARVHNEGRLRRAHTRKVTTKRKKQKQDLMVTKTAGRVTSPALPSNDSVFFAAQNAIHHGAITSVAIQNDQQLERHDQSGHHVDLGDRAMPDDELWNERNNEKAAIAGSSAQGWAAPDVHVHPSSPFTHVPVGSYFGDETSSPAPLPGTPSPLMSPHLTSTSIGGSAAMLSPDPYGDFGRGMHSGSSTNLLRPTTAASSTTHLTATQQHHGTSLHGPSHLSHGDRHPTYSDGDELAPTPSGPDVPIDLDEGENADMSVVSELARVGYPKLDRIIRQEAQQSTGRVLVSACGPNSLGILIRSIVSKQIDLRALRRGNLNAHINVATESYEWGG